MYDLNNLNLSEQIKKFRKSRNISLTQLGNLISKSKSTISKYENGTIIPDILTLLEICNCLNIDISELIPSCQRNIPANLEFNNLANISKLYLYYYTGKHLVRSIAELIKINDSNEIKVKFYNGTFHSIEYADKSSYYYEGKLVCDKTIGYINLQNIDYQNTQYEKIQISFNLPWSNNNDKSFFFLLGLTPTSIPIVKKGILSINEIANFEKFEQYLKISKDELSKIKLNNAWVLNDSIYDDLHFSEKAEL